MQHAKLSVHCKMFNDKVRIMNQLQKREVVLTAIEAKNLQADIFNLLAHVAMLQLPTANLASGHVDGGRF